MIKKAELLALNGILLGTLKLIYTDLESGWITKDSQSARRDRAEHKRRAKAAIETAESFD